MVSNEDEDFVEDDDATPLFNPQPTAMLVGVADELAQACAQSLDPIKTLRVAHGAAATQRMLTTHPLVIVVGAAVPAKDEAAIRQHAGAFGARVILESELEMHALTAQLKAAATAAMRARATQSM